MFSRRVNSDGLSQSKSPSSSLGSTTIQPASVRCSLASSVARLSELVNASRVEIMAWESKCLYSIPYNALILRELLSNRHPAGRRAIADPLWRDFGLRIH